MGISVLHAVSRATGGASLPGIGNPQMEDTAAFDFSALLSNQLNPATLPVDGTVTAISLVNSELRPLVQNADNIRPDSEDDTSETDPSLAAASLLFGLLQPPSPPAEKIPLNQQNSFEPSASDGISTIDTPLPRSYETSSSTITPAVEARSLKADTLHELTSGTNISSTSEPAQQADSEPSLPLPPNLPTLPQAASSTTTLTSAQVNGVVSERKPPVKNILDSEGPRSTPNIPTEDVELTQPKRFDENSALKATPLASPTASPTASSTASSTVVSERSPLNRSITLSADTNDQQAVLSNPVSGTPLPVAAEPAKLAEAPVTFSPLHSPNAGTTVTAQESQQKENKLELPTQFGTPRWAQDFGDRVVWASRNEVQSAQINVNPAHLGPIQINISLDGDKMTANFVSAHTEVRQAIEDAMPRLRDMLASSGINLGQANVGAQTQQQQRDNPAQFARQSLSTREDAILPDENIVATSGASTILQRGRGMVDLFA